NPPSKVGQVAAVKVWARELASQAARRDILVNAACPGLVDTGASRPWFDGMSAALSPDDAATDVLWLATLPPGTREPYGVLVQHRKVIPFTPPTEHQLLIAGPVGCRGHRPKPPLGSLEFRSCPHREPDYPLLPRQGCAWPALRM